MANNFGQVGAVNPGTLGCDLKKNNITRLYTDLVAVSKLGSSHRLHKENTPCLFNLATLYKDIKVTAWFINDIPNP